LRVVGHDRDSAAAKKAISAGAIHNAERDLLRACGESELIILAVPYPEVRLVLEHIAQDLKPDAVVIETAPLKVPTFEWAAQGWPRERHLVGAYLLARYPVPEAPAPLYERGVLVVVAPRGTDSSALEFATRLSPAIGATSFFVDAQEFDGLMAGTQGLPLLMALACYRAVADAPGWSDASRLAGDTFAEATQVLANCNPKRAAAELSANRENLLRRLELAQEELDSLRRLLSGDPDQLEAQLESVLREALDGRARWMASRSDPARSRPAPGGEMPSVADNFARMFGLGKDQLDILRRRKGGTQAEKS
jgi:prephenate dehydrogenase